jgi:hypothetical protein
MRARDLNAISPADWDSAPCVNRAVTAVAQRWAASAVPALPRGRVLFLQTIKHLLCWNSRAAHDPSLNRVFQFRHLKVFPFLVLFQESLPKTVVKFAINGVRSVVSVTSLQLVS